MDANAINELKNGLSAAYINGSLAANLVYKPAFISNNPEEGKKDVYKRQVPEGYACQGFVILGYIDGEQPKSKPRKPGRIKIVE